MFTFYLMVQKIVRLVPQFLTRLKSDVSLRRFYEFLGEQDIRAVDGTGSMHVRYDNDDTWYSAGLGFSMMQSEDMYYFIEAEKVFGAFNTGSYTISGGFRYMF